MTVIRTFEDIARIESWVSKVEADPSIDNLIGLAEAKDTANINAHAAFRRVLETTAALDRFTQPTPAQRAEREAVRRDESPQIAVFGRSAGLPEEAVADAETITKETLAQKQDRSHEEERLYRAMPGDVPDVSILDVEKARLDFCRIQVAAELAGLRAYDNDRSVNSNEFLDRVARESREAVNVSLDRDYGPGTAQAVVQLRPQLELDRKLRHAISAGATEQEIADLREELTSSLSAADMAQGDGRMRMTVNLLPEPARTDFMEVLGDERDLGPAVTAQQSPTVEKSDHTAARTTDPVQKQIDQEPVKPVGQDVYANLTDGMFGVVEADQAIRQAELEAHQMPAGAMDEMIDELRAVFDSRVKAMIAIERSSSIVRDLGMLPEPQKTDIEGVVYQALDDEIRRDHSQEHVLWVENPSQTKLVRELSNSYENVWAYHEFRQNNPAEFAKMMEDQARERAAQQEFLNAFGKSISERGLQFDNIDSYMKAMDDFRREQGPVIEQTDPAEFDRAMDNYVRDQGLQYETIGAAPAQAVEQPQTQRVNPMERTLDEDKVVQLRAQTRELGQLPSTVRAQQNQDNGMVLDRPHPTRVAEQQYNAVNQARLEQSQKDYNTNPAAARTWDRAYSELSERIQTQGEMMQGNIIPKRAVEELMELAFIKGDISMANILRTGLERAASKGRELTLHDIDPEVQLQDYANDRGGRPIADQSPVKVEPGRKLRMINGVPTVRERNEVGPYR